MASEGLNTQVSGKIQIPVSEGQNVGWQSSRLRGRAVRRASRDSTESGAFKLCRPTLSRLSPACLCSGVRFGIVASQFVGNFVHR
jgi:hypothetical protein